MALATPASTAAPRRWLPLFLFGAPTLGYGFYLFFVQFFFLKFATDVLLVGPAVMGVLFGLGRLWDAVSDPLVGYWSDRTRTRHGRRRPWMVAAVPLLALFFTMLWSPPAALEGGALVAWCAVALFGFYAGYTVYNIPHTSLGAELSPDHHERTRFFGAQRLGFMIGMFGAFGAMGYVGNAELPREAAREVVWAAVAVASALLLLAPLGLGERRENQGRGSGHPWSAVRDVSRNPHARVLLAAWFVEALGGGVLGVLAPYLTEYVFKRPDLIAVVPAFYVVPSALSIPVWISLSRRFGKRTVWRPAVVAHGVCFGLTFFVQEGQILALALLMVGAGVAGGCGGAIGASMLADVIDWDELRTGERKEGAYSAAFGFALKAAIAAVIMLTGVALEVSGFEPNVAQGRSAELTLRGLFSLAPLGGALLAALILGRFGLDADEHARIRRELDRRSG